MGNFIFDMLELGMDTLNGYARVKKLLEENKPIISKFFSGKEITIEEFFKIYDIRIYDAHSKRDDIRFMKQYDFKGVYIIYNKTKDTYYVGKSSNVMRKIRRHFEGYESQDVYNDWQKKHKFFVRAINSEKSEFNDINILEKECIKKYGYYKKDEKEKCVKEKLSGKRKESNNAVVVIFLLFLVGICFLLLYDLESEERKAKLEGKITAGCYEDYEGENYEDVKEKFEEFGFENIETVDLKDSSIFIWKNNKVDSVSIGGNDEFNEDDYFYDDEKVIIKYH